MTKNNALHVMVVLLLLGSQLVRSEAATSEIIAESYYRVQWGYFDEFLELFKKNHYPILKELEQQGYIKEILIDYPELHAGEQDRWDVRVTTVIRKKHDYQETMEKITDKLYPDRKKLKEEELKRFRLLLAHKDIRIRRQDLSDW